jgi:DNA-binding HxlR family transcriptional regulator
MSEQLPSMEEVLRLLEARLGQASTLAEQLINEALASGQVRDLVPADLQHRLTIPPELQQRLTEALRDLLVALRALIDWGVEQLEERQSEPVEVTDIPIA